MWSRGCRWMKGILDRLDVRSADLSALGAYGAVLGILHNPKSPEWRFNPKSSLLLLFYRRAELVFCGEQVGASERLLIKKRGWRAQCGKAGAWAPMRRTTPGWNLWELCTRKGDITTPEGLPVLKALDLPALPNGASISESFFISLSRIFLLLLLL